MLSTFSTLLVQNKLAIKCRGRELFTTGVNYVAIKFLVLHKLSIWTRWRMAARLAPANEHTIKLSLAVTTWINARGWSEAAALRLRDGRDESASALVRALVTTAPCMYIRRRRARDVAAMLSYKFPTSIILLKYSVCKILCMFWVKFKYVENNFTKHNIL